MAKNTQATADLITAEAPAETPDLLPPLDEPSEPTEASFTAGQINQLIDSWFKYNIHNSSLAQHGVHYRIVAGAVDVLKQAISAL